MREKITTLWEAVEYFFIAGFAGILLGIVFGLVTSFWIKKIFNDEILAVNIVLVSCYLVTKRDLLWKPISVSKKILRFEKEIKMDCSKTKIEVLIMVYFVVVKLYFVGTNISFKGFRLNGIVPLVSFGLFMSAVGKKRINS